MNNVNSFTPMLNALAPVVVLLGVGAACRAFLMPNASEWDDIHKLTYYVLLPALIIAKLSQISVTGVSITEVAVVMCTAQLFMFAASFMAMWQSDYTRENFCALMQHNLLINSYVALSVAQSYFGTQGAAVSMAALAFTVPLSNILGLWTLHMWGDPDELEEKLTLSGIMRSAPAVACLIGLWVYYMRVVIPPAIAIPLNVLGDAGLPLGLMAAGAGLNVAALKECTLGTWAWIVLRLLLFPVLVYCFCRLFGVTDVLAVAACVITAAAPTAAWGYVHVRRFGGDAPYAAMLIALSTVAATVTMPLVLWFLFRLAIAPA